MYKKVLTVFLTVILFLAAVFLGGATVFRVDDVALVATVVSTEAKAEKDKLQEEILALYKGESIFSVEETALEKVLKDYPYVRVTDFKKVYPNKIVVTVLEEAESYAVQRAEGGFYVLGSSGIVLDIRNVNVNRLDQKANVVLSGLTVTGKKGETLSGDECWASLFALCNAMDEKLGGIRNNVVSVEVLTRTPETFYAVTMREGVRIYIQDPDKGTEVKAEKVLDAYMALSNEERMTGRLTVREADGEVLVSYSPKDEFVGQ